MTPASIATAAMLATLPLLSACGHLSPGRAASVATGYVSHQLCSAVFVAQLDPARHYAQAIVPMAESMALLMRYEVDREHAEVRATLAGVAESRAAYRPPFGCVNVTGQPQRMAVTNAPTATAESEPVQPGDAALQQALGRAFDESPTGPKRHTQAVVVMHRDRIVAERYAPGIGVDTPLHGWSVTKSVTNALLGILVRQGRLDMQAPAPVAAWSDPGDPRHAITPDQLLRMTSGLDIGQSLYVASPFDPSARMVFVEHDMAAFAEQAPLIHAPGTHFTYTNPNTLLLSRIVRDSAGGDAASTLAFVRRELFDKLGMRHATFEFDGAGTPIGASHLWASARDWARFGRLYLHDGVIDGERILPAGWVDYSARPTPGAEFIGYGAGFWTNRSDGNSDSAGAGAAYRIAAGIPADALIARGSQGQYVVIVPSRQLVVVRLGPAWTERDDLATVARLVRDVIAALSAPEARAAG